MTSGAAGRVAVLLTFVGAAACVPDDWKLPPSVDAGDAGDADVAMAADVAIAADVGCAAASPTHCGGVCVDPWTDVAHCGACGHACASSEVCADGACLDSACRAPARCSGAACPACARVVFTEDWEAGTDGWSAFDRRPMTVASASAGCAGSYLHETVVLRQGGGRLYTVHPIAVVPGRTYCLSSWLRATPNSQPHLGFVRATASGTVSVYEQFWGLGACGDLDHQGGQATPTISDNVWRWYARQFTMPAGFNYLALRLQLFTGNAGSSADFDQIQLIEGPCPAEPATVCAAATCR